ncbi:unnamed protein product [Cochlearia groenlandica]
MASSMLFGIPLNTETEVEDVDVSRRVFFARYPNTRFYLDSESASMDSEPYPLNTYIDFFDRESSSPHEVETPGEIYVNPNQSLGTLDDFDIWGLDDSANEIELGLGIGSGSGSGEDPGQLRSDSGGVWLDVRHRETESGRVEEEEEEAMVYDEVMEVPQELEEEEEELDLPVLEWDVYVSLNNVGVVFEEFEDILVNYDGVMDSDHGVSRANLDEYGGIQGDVDEIDALLNQLFESAAAYNSHPPASKRAVEELLVVEITEEEASNGGIFCAICKDEIVVEEKVKRLPCRHYYHGECIVPWLEIRNTCPVCRYELPTNDLEYERFKTSQGRGSNASGLVSDLMSE